MTKKQQRRFFYDARNSQLNRSELSEIICNKIVQQVAYQQANTVMWYLHCRSEVETFSTVVGELENGKKIVIPYCMVDEKGLPKLGLWWLEDIAELRPGTWGILEPSTADWDKTNKQVSSAELDLIIVPGVAFDRQGGRLGNGAGYYDRLLQDLTIDTRLTAICFESQLCDKVVMEEHDIYMHTVVTERHSYTVERTSVRN